MKNQVILKCGRAKADLSADTAALVLIVFDTVALVPDTHGERERT